MTIYELSEMICEPIQIRHDPGPLSRGWVASLSQAFTPTGEEGSADGYGSTPGDALTNLVIALRGKRIRYGKQGLDGEVTVPETLES